MEIQEKHPEGAYYIEWYESGKRRRKSVGRDADVAFAEQQRQVHLLAAVAHGVDVVRPQEPKQVLLSIACSEFLEAIRQQRRPKTYKQYEVALRYFQECCGPNARVGEISRKDLLRFSAFLQNEKGLAARTSWTKFAVAVQLLNEHGKGGLLKRNDWPSYVESEPETYTDEELTQFFAACRIDEQVLFETFLMSGLREQEVQCLYKNDVDLKEQVLRVSAKKELGFIPKNWEHREVPMPDRLVSSLRRHIAALPAESRLIFATTGAQKDHHFLEACKRIAYRAGLNCGRCEDGEKACSAGPHCHNWYLHKFRSTFATKHLRNGVDLRTVQAWMGHKDLASTMRYLQPARGKDVLDKVNNTFGALKPSLVKQRGA